MELKIKKQEDNVKDLTRKLSRVGSEHERDIIRTKIKRKNQRMETFEGKPVYKIKGEGDAEE